MRGVVSFRNSLFAALELRISAAHNSHMRSLVGLLVGVALIFLIYRSHFMSMPTTDRGVAPTQNISLTGVRGDLLQIAQAERGYIALNGHCASLDELVSSNSLTMTRTQRDGYTYSLDCSGNDFTASAHHLPAPAGSPIRYPNLAIDATMNVHEIE